MKNPQSDISNDLFQSLTLDVIGQAQNHGHVALMQGVVIYQRDTVKVMMSAIVVLSVRLVNVLNGFHQMLSVALNQDVIGQT